MNQQMQRITDIFEKLRGRVRADLPEKDQQLADALLDLGAFFFKNQVSIAADLASISRSLEKMAHESARFDPNCVTR